MSALHPSEPQPLSEDKKLSFLGRIKAIDLLISDSVTPFDIRTEGVGDPSLWNKYKEQLHTGPDYQQVFAQGERSGFLIKIYQTNIPSVYCVERSSGGGTTSRDIINLGNSHEEIFQRTKSIFDAI